MNKGVSLVLRTEARKLTTSTLGRPVAVTHVAQITCPGSCPWKDGGGCYAELGPEGRVTRRLAASALAGNGAGAGSPDARALWGSLEEARQIWATAARAIVDGNGATRGVPLRLHVVGDAGGALGALVLGRAVARGWLRREVAGGPAWTYSHRWREIGRAVWGSGISVMASCETAEDVEAARGRGYVPALVADFDREGGGSLPSGGIPCPQQTGQRADCASCLACARDSRLRAGGRYIVLAPHGPAGRPTRAMRAKLDGYRVRGAGELGEAVRGTGEGVTS